MESNINKCSVQEARNAIYKNPNYQLVDVREQVEYDIVRIPMSLLVPLSTFEQDYTKINQNNPIYLLCGVGKRASLAAEFLASRGYKDLFVIEGGIKEWINAGYSFVGDKRKYTPE